MPSSTSCPACRPPTPHRGAPRPHRVSWTDRPSSVHPSDPRPHGCVVCLASTSEQEDSRSFTPKFPSWGERRSSRDADASSSETSKTRPRSCSGSLPAAAGVVETLVCADKRQRVALELLESERVYVSHLSLLLKANISFNGSEAYTCKDKR